jgi:ATP-citrate lyase beta-subunit
MAQCGIREYLAKSMLARHWDRYFEGIPAYHGKVALLGPDTKLDELAEANPWMKNEQMVAKPDMLFGKRGKLGLLKVNASLADLQEWFAEWQNKEFTIGPNTDKLEHWLIEPFTPHSAEYYIAIKSHALGDTVYFSMQGGVDIEENWDSVVELDVPIDADHANFDYTSFLPTDLGDDKAKIGRFVKGLYTFYAEMHFADLELNPFVVAGDALIPLDTVARLDDQAAFMVSSDWGDVEFPAPFGRTLEPEEAVVAERDEASGASLKLTIINRDANVWTMVAGGGASVCYADTIVDISGGAEDLANYGEYSGSPSEEETYFYAKTLLDLMTRKPDAQGRNKYLLVGGGIANFTDIDKTFAGIVRALTDYKEKLIENKVKVFVRRAGPNYEKGLARMRALGETLGVPIEVHGPEYHMTQIVADALAGK